MKYYVMHVSNDNLQIQDITEWSDLDKAKAKYHDLCKILWAEPSVITGYVVILDNQFDIVGDGNSTYKEFIKHEPQQTQPVTPSESSEESAE